jgi:two-component system, cell cycle sensor histidine kinase and response regulator CckA
MSAVAERVISVLLVEDDDEDYLFTRDLLDESPGARYQVHRASEYEAGASAAREGAFDVCLVDYRLGARNGIDLVRELVAAECDVPLILLTGEDDPDVDLGAADAGAHDYLVKGQITSTLLERTIRYAMQAHAHLQALRRHEESLRQAQRMEAVGQLAGGVAHDFNNLLLVIRGYSALLLSAGLDEELREHATQIDRAADQAANLTRQLLAYSRQQILRSETFDLNVIVQETMRMLERLIGEDVELRTSYADALPTVVVDRGQISQVILNLAVNARDAMPGGGALSVRTMFAELDEAYALEHPEVVAGPYVVLEMTDSGVGMDAATRERVFDPYFTTKETGNGLGLATVYGIVRQSGGHIWLYSEQGMGTTFKVYFPCGAADVRAPRAQEPGSLDGSETLLVVEDAELVRNLVSRVLGSFGYEVLTATNGEEAIDVACSHPGTIDLVFTDVVMPGMNGRELAERLTEMRPGLKVLFSSGYPADTIVRQGIAAARVAFIQKPYVSIELAEKVRQVLDSPA